MFARSIAYEIGQFFAEVIRKTGAPEVRWAILEYLMANRVSLSASEATLLVFLRESNIWIQGKYFPLVETSSQLLPNRQLFTYAQLYSAKDLWLNTVRNAASTGDFFATENNPTSILYRWGQLNDNNFSEAQNYIEHHSVNSAWLADFIRYFDVEINDTAILGLVADVARFRDNLLRLLPDDKHAQKIAAYLNHFLTRQAATVALPNKA